MGKINQEQAGERLLAPGEGGVCGGAKPCVTLTCQPSSAFGREGTMSLCFPKESKLRLRSGEGEETNLSSVTGRARRSAAGGRRAAGLCRCLCPGSRMAAGCEGEAIPTTRSGPASAPATPASLVFHKKI